MEYLIAIVLGAVGSLIAAEIWANGPALSEWLISRAVARLPEHERARFMEEWLANNSDFAGNIQKIVHAIKCWSGASSVARVLSQLKKTADNSDKPNLRNKVEARDASPPSKSDAEAIIKAIKLLRRHQQRQLEVLMLLSENRIRSRFLLSDE